MNTHELVLRQYLLQVLQGEQGRDAALCGMERHILMLSLDVKQVVVVDLIELVVGLHGDEIVRLADGVGRLLDTRDLGLLGADSLINGLYETREIERLKQIVDDREVEGIDGILRIGCGEDDGRFLLEAI